MRALITGPEQRSALAALREFAESNRINLATLFEIKGGRQDAPGESAQRRVEIAMGYTVVFTIEQHPNGWYRHLSVSVDGVRGAVPNSAAMDWIARELGFACMPDNHLVVYLEGENWKHPAVNWVERIEEEK